MATPFVTRNCTAQESHSQYHACHRSVSDRDLYTLAAFRIKRDDEISIHIHVPFSHRIIKLQCGTLLLACAIIGVILLEDTGKEGI